MRKREKNPSVHPIDGKTEKTRRIRPQKHLYNETKREREREREKERKKQGPNRPGY